MAYYTGSGEPPGQWHGSGDKVLGLSGKVDPAVIQQLFMTNISPAGEVLARQPRQHNGAGDLAAARAVRACKKDRPYG